MADRKWNFQCNQVFDFNNLSQEEAELSSFFDKKCEEKLKDNKICGEESEEAKKENERARKERRVYRFTAGQALLSKPIVKKDQNLNGMRVLPSASRKTLRASFGKSNRNTRRSATHRFMVPKVATKQLDLPPVTETAAAPPPPQDRRLATSPLPSAPVTRKPPTRPMTPECLKRSLNKVKTAKSSEQLELEKIAEMRRKLKSNLELNKATMKKARAPALQPLRRPERPKSPVSSSQEAKPNLLQVNIPQMKINEPEIKTDSSDIKVNEVKKDFKMPMALSKARSAIGFSCDQQKPPYNLRQERRRSRSVDSASSRISSLNLSINSRSTIKSLNVCHSGIKFIPKQQLNSSSKQISRENKEPKKSINKADSKIQACKLEIPKISKPLQDKTNQIPPSKINIKRPLLLPMKGGLKRKSNDSFIEERKKRRL